MIQILQKGFSLFPETLICLRVLGVGDIRNSGLCSGGLRI